MLVLHIGTVWWGYRMDFSLRLVLPPAGYFPKKESIQSSPRGHPLVSPIITGAPFVRALLFVARGLRDANLLPRSSVPAAMPCQCLPLFRSALCFACTSFARWGAVTGDGPDRLLGRQGRQLVASKNKIGSNRNGWRSSPPAGGACEANRTK